MKILVVCTTDSMIWNFLVPHIKHLQSCGLEVECACSRSGFYFDELIERHRLIVHELCCTRNPFNIYNFKAYIQLRKIIRDGEFDVVYCHEPVGGMLGRIAGKRCGKYVMYIAHGFHFFRGAPIKHWLLYYTAEYILSFFTDALVTICAEDFSRAKKLHAKRCYQIPGIGADFDRFDQEGISDKRNEIRTELHLGQEDIVLITVGELSKRKNQRVILEAMSRISNPNIKLLICGEGDLLEQLKRIVANNDLEGRVLFLGFRKDIPRLLSIADIFVFPSLWEGLGIAGIEAMYCGLPIIGSDRRGIKDYVKVGKSGYLFEPDDIGSLSKLIVSLSEDSLLRKKIGFYARQSARKYSLENSLDALDKIYLKEKIM